MANNRIFYACQAVAIAPCYVAGDTMVAVHGVQSVGVNTTFNLEQAFELGQIQIYENIENVPDIEVTLEKVLDGYPLIYHLASSGATSSSLVSRAKERCCVALGIYGDDKDAVSGIPPVEIYMSGMYFSNLSYKLVTDGNCTESVTLVGNSKVWNISGVQKITAASITALNNNIGSDEPLALVKASGGIQRRENVLISSSILPISIFGVTQTATSGNAWDSTNGPKVHVQDCTISTDLSRDPIMELGRKAPYYRAPKYPVEVTCEFNAISVSGDFVTGYEEGNPAYKGTRNEGNNTSQETIKIMLQDGTVFDLGTKCRLSSVTYGGGDAGGGNVSMKYSYSTYNQLTVLHPQDPAGLKS
jgi:3D (Asp-Asp-Asp) domain-containing protein